MGIIFTDQAKRAQIKDLLPSPQGRMILSRLQAGRIKTPGGGSAPYRLSDEDFEILKDEWIRYQASDCWYAMFEKPVNEIRALLGLPPQSNNPFDW